MTKRRSPFRGLVLFGVLLCSGLFWLACRQHGTVEERNGIRYVTNAARGVDDDKVREELKPVWKVGGQPGQPAFSVVMWADVDSAGNVYVLDYRQQQITRLTPDGKVAGQFGRRGPEPGELSKSRRFVLSDGKLYFANEGNGRIEVLGTEGQTFPPVQLANVQKPGEIYRANGTFYVTRRFVPNGAYVYAYDSDWKLERALRPADQQEDRLDVIRSHNTVCPASDGLWIVHMLMNRIEKIGWDGRVLVETSRDLDWTFPKDEHGKVLPEILVHRACAVDPAGNLYVVYSNPEDWKRGNEVYKFGPDGLLRQKAFTLPVFNVTMMRFDAKGNFYFGDETSLTKATIQRSEG